MPIIQCPKCGYQRQPTDSHTLAGTCPACGIAYQKWLDRQQNIEPEPPVHLSSRPQISLLRSIKDKIVFIAEPVDPVSFYGRVFLFAVFFCWGWSFILGGINWETIGGSFLHSAILPFHEFGHVLFSPFGRFMAILGGSLFQVLMPLGIMLAFVIQRRDNFAASIMLWWCGQSFIDLSPYISDAPYRAIPLIRGLGEEAHDWGNLLTMTNSLDSALSLARLSFGLGSLLILLSFIWGGYILYRQKQLLP